MLLFLAGLQTIPAELYEAAEIDGATPWQRFVNVTIPGLRHVSRILVLLLTIWSLGYFVFIYLITGGGPARGTETLARWLVDLGMDEARRTAPPPGTIRRRQDRS